MTRARITTRRTSRAFTLVELLVVITIIFILVGLVLYVASGAIGNARRTATIAAVNSIGQGVETFRSDFNGQAPPLITRVPRGGFTNAADNSILVPEMLATGLERAEETRDARYFSEWTLGVFLLGTGDLNGDGTETYSTPGNPQPNLDDGHEGLGFRDPGPLLAWKRPVPGNPGARPAHQAARTGRVYGPYLETGLDDFVENVEVAPGIYLPRLIDSWGNPIRFYSGYPTREPGKGYSTSIYMPQELNTTDAAKLIVEKYDFGLPFLPGDDLQELVTKNRSVLSSDYVILAAADDPQRWLDRNGGPVAPYGDVALDGNFDRIDLVLSGTAQSPSPFDPSLLNTTGDTARENWRDMIESNVRYTP